MRIRDDLMFWGKQDKAVVERKDLAKMRKLDSMESIWAGNEPKSRSASSSQRVTSKEAEVNHYDRLFAY